MSRVDDLCLLMLDKDICLPFNFVDVVSGSMVYIWRDKYGEYWMAESR